MSSEIDISDLAKKSDEMIALLSVIVRLSIPKLTPEEHSLTGDQEAIYNLCDANHTIEVIAETIGKPPKQIRTSLSRLRTKGLIDSVKKLSKVYYFRVPFTSEKGEE